MRWGGGEREMTDIYVLKPRVTAAEAECGHSAGGGEGKNTHISMLGGSQFGGFLKAVCLHNVQTSCVCGGDILTGSATD